MTIYNDRVYAYERMQQTDKLIEDDPSPENIKKLLDDDERNLLGFRELESYNNSHTFLYVHPLLKKHKLESDLERLRKSNPERFMKELINADKSITRYQSLINNRKYKNKQELAAWRQHIQKFREKKEIMKQLLSV